MSLATDLTQCQQRLQEAGRSASAECRRLRGIAPTEVYDELMLNLCVFASETNQLKVLLGSLRMIGELEQRPAAVTAESLELAQCGRDRSDMVDRIDESEHTRRAFAHELEMIGDDTLADSGKEEA
ncbi:MAG: hypothetical protein Q8M07_08330 [Prosthecobacter sp.]|nr:hypothetical protein [Prosthecobacter sp.]